MNSILMLDKIRPEEILERADVLASVDADHSYQKSYQYFIEYFADGRTFSEMDFVIGANFTYGWMPTILEFKSSDFDAAVIAINLAKAGQVIGDNHLEAIKAVVNNSLVGTSKLLHLINPNTYAIWDSRVCNFLLCKKNQNLLTSFQIFNEYLELCQRVALHSDFQDIHDSFKSQLGYEISKLRTVEQIMFLNSDKPLK